LVYILLTTLSLFGDGISEIFKRSKVLFTSGDNLSRGENETRVGTCGSQFNGVRILNTSEPFPVILGSSSGVIKLPRWLADVVKSAVSSDLCRISISDGFLGSLISRGGSGIPPATKDELTVAVVVDGTNVRSVSNNEGAGSLGFRLGERSSTAISITGRSLACTKLAPV